MNTNSLTRMVSVIGLSIIAVSTPLSAQTNNAGYESDANRNRAMMHEPAGAETDHRMNWSWLGLFGLLGLLGLRHRRDVRDETYRTRSA